MFVTPAFAQSADAAAGGGAAMIANIVPLILIFIIFWFFLIRPQQRAMKAHKAKIEAAKRGDQVVTGGGLIGKITKVDGDVVEVEIAQGIKVKAVKATLTDVNPPVSAKPAND